MNEFERYGSKLERVSLLIEAGLTIVLCDQTCFAQERPKLMCSSRVVVCYWHARIQY